MATETGRFLREQQQEQWQGVGELYERSIDTMQLSVRVFNALKRSGIHTVGELVSSPPLLVWGT